MILIYLFSISALALLVLFLHKIYALKRGGFSISRKAIISLDQTVDKTINLGKDYYNHTYKQATSIVQSTLQKSSEQFISKVVNPLKEVQKSFLLDSRGTRVLSGGKTSDYLNKIGTVKSNGQHRIDDDILKSQ
jgi:hypothetical protein